MKDPFVHDDDLAITLKDGYRLFSLNVDDTERHRGGRGDGPTQAKLKNALFVESYLTFCKFQAMDIRARRPDLYSDRQLRIPDDRNSSAREADAMALIAPCVGAFTLDTCLSEGRKRAPAWFNMTAAALKDYMQTSQLNFARVASGALDTDLIEPELQKLKVLVHAINRAYENRENHKALVRESERKRPRKTIYSLHPFSPEKFRFPGIESAYLLALHGGVDPTDLWFGLRRYSPFFKAIVLVGLEARKQPFGEQENKDLKIVRQEVMPYLDGIVLPKDEVIKTLLRLYVTTDALHERFEEKTGLDFGGPHG